MKELYCRKFSAFDTMNWWFLTKTLTAVGFQPRCTESKAATYSNPESCVVLNGCCSEFLSLVNQGDCLSSLIDVINIELFATLIEQNETVNDIKADRQKEHKTWLYGRDILTDINDPISSCADEKHKEIWGTLKLPNDVCRALVFITFYLAAPITAVDIIITHEAS